MARQHCFRSLTHRTGSLALALLLLAAPAALQAEEAKGTESSSAAAPEAQHALRDEDAPEASLSPQPPSSHFGKRGRGGRHGRRSPHPPPAVEPDLSKFSPEERHRFEENRKRWDALSLEEKEKVRKRHEEHRARMQKSVDRAIIDSGLTLNEEQRRDFSRRFIRERRKIERELRREMNEKRHTAVEALVKRLAEEFRKETPAPPKAGEASGSGE